MLSALLLAASLTLVEYNCENLFDCRHDEGYHDEEFLPDADRHWTPWRYWRKLNHVGQALLAASSDLPDLVALVEVENDSVLHDLTRRSLLRNAGYHYLMTTSDDTRGLDVALIYQPARFRPLCYDCLRIPVLPAMRPTRDILYVRGIAACAPRDTLHLFVVHAPSRYGGERDTRDYRRQAALTILGALATLPTDALVIVAGDFNDYTDSPSLRLLTAPAAPSSPSVRHNGTFPSAPPPVLHNATATAHGANGARATYRYQGDWRSLDHILLSSALLPLLDTAYIADAPFLLEPDDTHGGLRPCRTYLGPRYHGGVSDHLPLVLRLHPRPLSPQM